MDNKVKSIDEMASDLSEEQQKVLERFQYDMSHSPVRKLSSLEREIYASSIMRAIEILPSFRDALALMSPFMDATSSTAYTDKYARVGLSYWFFYLADRDTRAVALLHESMHVLYNHFPRFSSLGITPMKGNIAGDLEINSNLSLLPKIKIILEDFILPDNKEMNFPYFKTLEQYSTLINDKLKENEKKKQEKEEKDSGDSSDGDSEQEQGSSQSGQGESQDDSDSDESGEGSGQGQSQGSSDSDSQGEGTGQESSSNSQGDSKGSGQGSSSNGQGSSSGNESSEKGSSGGSPGKSNDDSGEVAEPSEHGNSYDDYVRRASGEKPVGSPSLEEMMQDNNDPQQGNGSGGSDSSDSSNDDTQSDVDTSGGSFKGHEKSNNVGGPMKRVKPSYRCDHSTPDRMDAADNAEVEKKSSTSQNIARRNTKARIVQEVNSKGVGNGSANEFLKVASAMMNPPKVDWRDLFRRAVARSYNNSIAGRSFDSYKRVNRRGQGSIIFPGKVDYQPTAMFGVDTSGSMGKRDYENLLSEIEGIMKNGMRSKDALKTFCVDTEIKGIEMVRSVKDLKLTGGGGTEMAVAFRFVNSLPKKQQPDIFVLGTDGGLYGDDWKNIYNLIRQGKYSVIILITSDYGMNNVPAYIRQVATLIDVSESDASSSVYG